jgi:nitroreductase
VTYTLPMVEELGGHSLDVIDAVRRRRMHRQFDPRPIPRSVLACLAWAAGRAQTARPGARTVVVVDDPGLMRTARDVLPGFTNNAPAMIVIATNLDGMDAAIGRRGPEHTSRLDSGAAAANLALAAQSFGIGVCTVTSWSDAAVRALFDLPADVRPDVTVALGYQAANPRPAPRGSHDPAVYLNRYGNGFAANSAGDVR